MTELPKPNEKLGRSMIDAVINSGTTITIDEDVLRSVATSMVEHAEKYEALAAKKDEGITNTENKGKEGTRSGDVAPIHKPGVTSLNGVYTKVSKQLITFANTLRTDAAALVWIADQNAANENARVKDIEQVDTSTAPNGTTTTQTA